MCGVPEDTKLMHLFMHKIVQVSFQSGCFCFQRHFSFFPFTLLSLVRLEADRKWTKRLGERGLLIQAWPHAEFKVFQLNCIFSICIVYTVLAESNTFNLMQKGNGEVFFPGKWNQLLTVFSKQWHHQHLDWLPLRSAFIFTIPAPSENKSKLAKLGEKKITFFACGQTGVTTLREEEQRRWCEKWIPFFSVSIETIANDLSRNRGVNSPHTVLGELTDAYVVPNKLKRHLGTQSPFSERKFKRMLHVSWDTIHWTVENKKRCLQVACQLQMCCQQSFQLTAQPKQ